MWYSYAQKWRCSNICSNICLKVVIMSKCGSLSGVQTLLCPKVVIFEQVFGCLYSNNTYSFWIFPGTIGFILRHSLKCSKYGGVHHLGLNLTWHQASCISIYETWEKSIIHLSNIQDISPKLLPIATASTVSTLSVNLFAYYKRREQVLLTTARHQYDQQYVQCQVLKAC